MASSEDHRGSLRLVDLSEVSHARVAIIADHLVVECTGWSLFRDLGGWVARRVERSA
jgi:hypothetical protein